MALYKEVELVDGRTVKVYRPPTQQILALVRRQFPEPEAPVVVEKTVTGQEKRMVIEDDPAYLKEHERWELRVNQEVDQRGLLFVFKDLEVPEDWDVEAEVGDLLRVAGDEEWKPTEGRLGLKFDYIRWTIVSDIANATRILRAQAELSGVPWEEVQANTASFRDQVEGEAD